MCKMYGPGPYLYPVFTQVRLWWSSMLEEARLTSPSMTVKHVGGTLSWLRHWHQLATCLERLTSMLPSCKPATALNTRLIWVQVTRLHMHMDLSAKVCSLPLPLQFPFNILSSFYQRGLSEQMSKHAPFCTKKTTTYVNSPNLTQSSFTMLLILYATRACAQI
jgi:hypothetical protein